MAKTKQSRKTKQDLLCPAVSYNSLSAVHEALKHYLGYLLHRNTLLYKAGAAERFATLNLQGFHVATLAIIDAEASVNQIQICAETGVDKATMVKTIDHLEKMKLVERVESKDDRRVKNLNITKKGKAVLAQADKIRAECEASFLSVLTDKEAEQFRAMLLKLMRPR